MKILKPFFHAGALRRPGDEAALLDTKPSDDQIAGWIDRELIEADGVAAKSDGDALQGNGLEAQLLGILSDYVGETGENEGAVETLERIVDERDEMRETAESLRQTVDAQARRINELQAELESLREPEAPATETPVEAKELTDILKSAKGALALLNAGFDTREKIISATDAELDELDDIAEKSIEKLRAAFAG